MGLQLIYEQSLDDLAGLRLPIEGTDMKSFVPAAGIPWFAALFGRDSLITALQTVAVYPDFARGALEVLARYQADDTDDSRDMQPGKIPHELRRGELAQLGLVPYRPYYGTADATPLYIVLLHHAWRFTGDRGLIERHLGTAERCLEWIDRFGDMDGDGFQEYQRRTPAGAENQAWKDSGNAILDENGDDVPAPKAVCELQGYVYDAWRRMAKIYDALGQPDRAAALRAKAQSLYDRFNAAFWDEGQQFYALCLDPRKRRVMSIASNAGHLLWSGIVPRERAAAVTRRLMADDMWSGWGVRTLSAAHPAYNPHDYQLGAIWPHDNGLIAVGLKQYGFHAEAARIAGGLVEAGSRFLLNRLPEVFAGTSRDESPFPDPVSRGERAASLGGRFGLQPDPGVARYRIGRRRLCDRGRSLSPGLAARAATRADQGRPAPCRSARVARQGRNEDRDHRGGENVSLDRHSGSHPLDFG